jgi:hypothetical protein
VIDYYYLADISPVTAVVAGAKDSVLVAGVEIVLVAISSCIGYRSSISTSSNNRITTYGGVGSRDSFGIDRRTNMSNIDDIHS